MFFLCPLSFLFPDILVICHDFQCLHPDGFTNTDNVWVWPAEEALVAYLLNHTKVVEGKTVLQLGAGVTGMAGMILAKVGGIQNVYHR